MLDQYVFTETTETLNISDGIGAQAYGLHRRSTAVKGLAENKFHYYWRHSQSNVLNMTAIRNGNIPDGYMPSQKNYQNSTQWLWNESAMGAFPKKFWSEIWASLKKITRRSCKRSYGYTGTTFKNVSESPKQLLKINFRLFVYYL